MAPYLDALISKLLALLQRGRRNVQEGALTAIAAVADTAEVRLGVGGFPVLGHPRVVQHGSRAGGVVRAWAAQGRTCRSGTAFTQPALPPGCCRLSLLLLLPLLLTAPAPLPASLPSPCRSTSSSITTRACPS